MASEAGVLPIPESKIVKKWRLQPGKMFLIDMEQGRIIDDKELKDNLANAKPYKSWIDAVRIKLDEIEPKAEDVAAGRTRRRAARPPAGFGYTQEDLKFLMAPMAAQGEEAVGSMGNDSPLAVLSNKNKPLYNYFKQLFAQVTNPPIDPIRENMVMSLVSFIGPKPNLLDTNNINPPMRLEVSQPVLDFKDIAKIRASTSTRRQVQRVRAEHLLSGGLGQGRHRGAPRVAVRRSRGRGEVRLQHPDRVGPQDRCRPRRDSGAARHVGDPPAPGPARAAHEHGLVVETGSARETHHFALLAGYGAKPCTRTWRWKRSRRWPKACRATCRREGDLQLHKAVGKGLQKVMSKMGISTYMSYTARRSSKHRPVERPRREVLQGHGIEGRRHRRVRGRGRSDPPAPRCVRRQPGAARHARRRRRVRLPRARRRPHVDAGFDRQAAARDAQQLVPDVQGIRALINDQTKRHMTLRGLFEFKVDPARSRSTTSSRPRKSSSASPRARCRSARSAPKRTRRWRSR
jgi:glutamate synthase (NADPH/NADH) large chain/glutamate synthase (ferredoxin)